MDVIETSSIPFIYIYFFWLKQNITIFDEIMKIGVF